MKSPHEREGKAGGPATPEREPLSPVLQRYLDAAAAPMRRVSPERRDAVLDEIRSHIEALIEDYQTAGDAREAAEARAIKMMGEPKRLGKSLVRAWYQTTEPGTILTAIGVTTIAQTALQYILTPTIMYLNRTHPSQMLSVSHAHQLHMFDFQSMLNLAIGFTNILPSLVAGWFSPRRAVPAAAIMGAMRGAYYVVSLLVSLHYNSFGSEDYVVRMIISALIPLIFCAPSAWASRRLRMYRRAGV